MDKELAQKRQYADEGVTVWEARLLELRSKGLKWTEIARVMEVTRGRVSQMKKRLIEKGLLDESGEVTKEGTVVLNG